MTILEVEPEIDIAIKRIDQTILNIGIPAKYNFREKILRLTAEAISIYDMLPKHLKHAIALDEFLTVMISKPPPCHDKPIFCIYYNLTSDYFNVIIKGNKINL